MEASGQRREVESRSGPAKNGRMQMRGYDAGLPRENAFMTSGNGRKFKKIMGFITAGALVVYNVQPAGMVAVAENEFDMSGDIVIFSDDQEVSFIVQEESETESKIDEGLLFEDDEAPVMDRSGADLTVLDDETESETESEAPLLAELEADVIGETETKTAAETETESELSAEIESETFTESGVETEAATEAQAETETAAEAEPETPAVTETAAETSTETDTEPASDPEASTETETEAEELDATEAAETEVVAETETEAEANTETGTEAESETNIEIETIAEVESETETVTGSDAETEAETETESETVVSSPLPRRMGSMRLPVQAVTPSAVSLTITNNVGGNMGNRAGIFHFTMKLTVPEKVSEAAGAGQPAEPAAADTRSIPEETSSDTAEDSEVISDRENSDEGGKQSANDAALIAQADLDALALDSSSPHAPGLEASALDALVSDSFSPHVPGLEASAVDPSFQAYMAAAQKAATAVPETIAYTYTRWNGDVEHGSLSVEDGEVSFVLQDGESIEFSGLPEGLQFDLAESDQEFLDYSVETSLGDRGGTPDRDRSVNGSLSADTRIVYLNSRSVEIPE